MPKKKPHFREKLRRIKQDPRMTRAPQDSLEPRQVLSRLEWEAES
jgi:hypothetical protein